MVSVATPRYGSHGSQAPITQKAKKLSWRNNMLGWQNYSEIEDWTIARFSSIRSRLARSSTVLGESTLNKIVTSVRDGDLKFLGVGLPSDESWADGAPSPTIWLRDPTKGCCWPGADIYCFNVNFRHASEKFGDVKYVRELNRLQFLHPIAAHVAATGDTTLTRWAFQILASWMAANPPFRGVNWVSG